MKILTTTDESGTSKKRKFKEPIYLHLGKVCILRLEEEKS